MKMFDSFDFFGIIKNITNYLPQILNIKIRIFIFHNLNF